LLLDISHKILLALVNNLRVHVKPMYQLYSFLKDRDEPPTPEEIDIASAKRKLDGEYLQKLEKSSENIRKAFQNQQVRAIVSEISLGFLLLTRLQGPWDQEKFEQLVMEWVIACDQPFEEVERPEFLAMMRYAHHTGTSLKIPKRDGIKRQLMKMGDNTIEGVRKMFLVRSYLCLLPNVLIPE
jgi:hypothetical protein